jgi:hypothetical protein
LVRQIAKGRNRPKRQAHSGNAGKINSLKGEG